MKSSRNQEIKFLSLLSEKMVNQRMTKLNLGLTPSQTMIMMDLYESGQPLLQKQIEQKLYISHATTRGMIKRLQKAGMITTSPMPRDQRQVLVNLTEQGRIKMTSQADKINQVLDEAEKQLANGISQRDLATFDRILAKMKANF